MTVQGDSTILVPLNYTRLLKWIGQLASLGLISVANTSTIVNNLWCLTELYAASKVLSTMAIIKQLISALSVSFFLL